MFVADYYIKKTSDLLSDYNLPSTTGYDKMRVNLASIENKGVELSLTTTPVRTRDFSWSTTVTGGKMIIKSWIQLVKIISVVLG